MHYFGLVNGGFLKKLVVSIANVLLLLVAILITPVVPASAFDLSTCTINGTTGDDTLIGTANKDVICGRGGNDTIYARAGNDVVFLKANQTAEVFLEEGDDFLDASLAQSVKADGGPGNDELIGSNGNDELSGGEGDSGDEDLISAGAGNDLVEGEAGEVLEVFLGDGDDQFNGGYADESTVEGGDGEDIIFGTPGPDNLFGNAGADVIWAGAQNDQISGGSGNDTIAGESGIDLVNGGFGLNNCDYTETEVRTTTCIYDDNGPVLTSAALSTYSVDVTNSDVKLQLTINFTDQTGIGSVWINCENFGASFDFIENFGYVEGPDGLARFITLLSSTKTSATLEIPVPKGTRPGASQCKVRTSDALRQIGNELTLENEFVIIRTGDGWDDFGPTISNLTISPDSVDVSEASQSVTIEFDVADVSRVSYVNIGCGNGANQGFWISFGAWFIPPGDEPFTINNFERVENLTLESSGTAYNGHLAATFQLNQNFASGIYTCSVQARDNGGRVSGYEEMKTATFQLFNTGTGADQQGPEILQFYTTPNAIDVGAEDQSIDIVITAADRNNIYDGYIICANFNSDAEVIQNVVSVYFLFQNNEVYLGNNSFDTTDLSYTLNGSLRQLNLVLHAKLRFGLAPGDYTCGLSITDSLGNQSFTDTSLTINRTPPGQPTSPSNVSFVSKSPTEGILTWNVPEFLGDPLLKTYEVQFSLDGRTWKSVSHPFDVATKLDLKNLKAATNYWFRVRGENGGEYGAWSESIQYLTPPPDSVTSQPQGISGFALTGGKSVLLNWLEPKNLYGSEISDYLVEFSNDKGSTWNLVTKTVSNSLQLTVDGLGKGREYLFRVSSVNQVGQSEPSDSLKIKTQVTLPAAPVNFSVVDGSLTATSVRLKWDAPKDRGGLPIKNYVVQFLVKGKTWRTVEHEISAKRIVTIKGLKPGKNYRFRVKTQTSHGKSSDSAFVEFKTLE